MNELRRMAYLDAMGIDCYVSRTQLPGAALTRRLALVAKPIGTLAAKALVDVSDTPGADKSARADVTPNSGAQQAGVTRPDFGHGARGTRGAVEPRHEPSQASEPAPRFSLVTIVAGAWLWLEELHGMPLATEQVQLVQSMAQALSLSGGDNPGSAEGPLTVKPDVAQFAWPMHTNRQLDLGEEAARASVAAFVSRKLEQHRCRGLVLLGQACVQRLLLSEMKILAVSTASSADILANPARKRQVWRDLQPLLGNS